MKNATSILSGCIVPKCVSCNNCSKALSLCYNQFPHIIRTRHQNRLRTSKQLVCVLYSEMTSLSSIFSYCKVNKMVPSKKDRKARSGSHNHLWHIFINHTLESSAGQTINFLYNLTSIVNCCIGPKCVTSNNENKMSDNDVWLIFYNSTRKSSADKQVTY